MSKESLDQVIAKIRRDPAFRAKVEASPAVLAEFGLSPEETARAQAAARSVGQPLSLEELDQVAGGGVVPFDTNVPPDYSAKRR